MIEIDILKKEQEKSQRARAGACSEHQRADAIVASHLVHASTVEKSHETAKVKRGGSGRRIVKLEDLDVIQEAASKGGLYFLRLIPPKKGQTLMS